MQSEVLDDQTLAAAVDVARQAAVVEAIGSGVGAYLGMQMEGELLGNHMFECEHPGYRGWHWAVTVARAPEADLVTVCDVVLLPGADALRPPAWLPWSERVLPGDLGVGDVLGTSVDDERLIAGLTGEDDLETVASASPLTGYWEIGLGRVRVLSAFGRDEAADRWYEGDMGPTAAMARSATEHCSSCGFMLTIGGPLGQMFGICANLISPADGHVVAMDYGCGGHSEVEVEVEELPQVVAPTTDEFDWDHVDLTSDDLVTDLVEPVDELDELDESEELDELEGVAVALVLAEATGADPEIDDAADPADETDPGDVNPPTVDPELLVENPQDDANDQPDGSADADGQPSVVTRRRRALPRFRRNSSTT